MRVAAVRCLKCNDTIWSRATHDWRPCKCGECFIDGGRSYTRIGFKEKDGVLTGWLDTDTDEFHPYEDGIFPE